MLGHPEQPLALCQEPTSLDQRGTPASQELERSGWQSPARGDWVPRAQGPTRDSGRGQELTLPQTS